MPAEGKKEAHIPVSSFTGIHLLQIPFFISLTTDVQGEALCPSKKKQVK
jgi:hypothetical protein